MGDIDRVLAKAARRLLINAWIRAFVTALIAVGVTLAVLLTLHKAGLVSIPWREVVIAAGPVAIAIALIAALAKRRRGVDLADEVDRRAGLRETLSTAMVVSGRNDAWSKAVVESAGERARRVVVHDAVPFEAPRLWWVPPAMFASLCLLAFVPRQDVIGLLASDEQEVEEQRQVELAKLDVQSKEQQLEEVLKKAGVDLDEEDEADRGAEEFQKPEPRTPEEIRRASIRKLTKLQDKMKEMRSGEEGQRLDAIRQALRNLETEPGPLAEFGRSLARSNFSEAKQKLEQLAQMTQDGTMSSEEREELQKSLDKMQGQLKQLAESREQLKEALQQATGMSEAEAEQAASDPAALEQALQQQAPGMGQEQIDQLQQMAEAQRNAMDAMNGLAQAMQQMSQGMQQAGEGQQGQQGQAQMETGAQAAAGQLSAMEQLASEMAALDQAMAEAGGMAQQMGQAIAGAGNQPGGGQQGANNPGVGNFQQGDSQNQSAGSGGAGQGEGADAPPGAAAQFVLNRENADVENTGEGPIISSTLVWGSQVRGQSTAAFSQAVEAASVRASEAVETMQVPRELHEAVKVYFGRLEKAAEEARERQRSGGDGSGSDG